MRETNPSTIHNHLFTKKVPFMTHRLSFKRRCEQCCLHVTKAVVYKTSTILCDHLRATVYRSINSEILRGFLLRCLRNSR